MSPVTPQRVHVDSLLFLRLLDPVLEVVLIRAHIHDAQILLLFHHFREILLLAVFTFVLRVHPLPERHQVIHSLHVVSFALTFGIVFLQAFSHLLSEKEKNGQRVSSIQRRIRRRLLRDELLQRDRQLVELVERLKTELCRLGFGEGLRGLERLRSESEEKQIEGG